MTIGWMTHAGRAAAVLAVVLAAAPRVATQSTTQTAPAQPTFEVVSIKRNPSGALALAVPPQERPDGSFRLTNVPLLVLLNRAYPFIERVNLPAWASSERYDISTASSIPHPTAEQRLAMVRALLADRFKLAVHVEKSEQPAYDLVVARRDGRLGAGLTKIETDCEAKVAADRAETEAAVQAGLAPPLPQRPDFSTPPPACTTRIIGGTLRDMRGDKQGKLGDLLEGEATMDMLATTLRISGRVVVNKTNLPGSYRVRMNFDLRGTVRPADTAPDTVPTLFTALQEQLGLKLEPSRHEQERLVIDRLEHPSED